MATLTVSSQDFIKPVRLSTVGEIRSYPEGASQTYRLGAILVKSTVSGYENYVVQADTTGAAYPTTGTVVGIAASAASGTTGTGQLTYVANDNQEFIGRIQDGSAIAATMQGLACGIVYDTTNTIWRVDTTNTSAAGQVVVITELVDPVGDVNGRVYFQFNRNKSTPYS